MPDAHHTNPIDGYEMLLAPAGKAVFGETDGPFEAELPGYYLGTHCVTNGQYAAFLNADRPSAHELNMWIMLGDGGPVVQHSGGYGVDDAEGYADHPMVRVSWHGARAYCKWAGLRLPSELQWEKGARGTEGRIYPWGDAWDPDACRHAESEGCSGPCGVAEYPEGKSAWGLLNMSGNVWEWCADWYEPNAYERYARGDLTPPRGGRLKILHGGAWNSYGPGLLRAACRVIFDPSCHHGYVGFRCARDVD